MIIYLDLDGVLVNTHIGALKWYDTWSGEYPKGKRVKNIIDETHGNNSFVKNITHEQFWAGLPVEFWKTLDKTLECDLLIHECVERVGKDNVFFASRPANSVNSWIGKSKWVEQNLPSWCLENLILIQKKTFLVDEFAVLIDDSKSNCHKFAMAGGNAIFYKRPWNGHDHLRFVDVLSKLDGLQDEIGTYVVETIDWE